MSCRSECLLVACLTSSKRFLHLTDGRPERRSHLSQPVADRSYSFDMIFLLFEINGLTERCLRKKR